jgi:hypothetical protein
MDVEFANTLCLFALCEKVSIKVTDYSGVALAYKFGIKNIIVGGSGLKFYSSKIKTNKFEKII